MADFLMLSLLVWLFFLSTCAQTNNDDFLPQWKWTCQNDQCVREVGVPVVGQENVEACRLSCGPYGGLWPLPTGEVVLSGKARLLNLECIGTDVTGVVGEEAQAFLIAATKRLQAQLRIQKQKHKHNNKTFNKFKAEDPKQACLRIEITTTDGSLALDWTTDEAYNLGVEQEALDSILVKINSATAYGARHGIETVGQLIGFHSNQAFVLDRATISDRPLYPHRGLMMDTARHFIPLDVIKRQVEAMSASKLNVLHWHITDAQSFPFMIPSRPKLTKYGAYSSDQIYTPEDIRALREFSLERGIRILIEIDAPAHASFGWQWGPEEEMGDLAVCVNAQPWRQFCVQPPCGQLNPTNPNVYKVLRQIYRHVLDIWDAQTTGAPPVLFHMGGDEVHIGCWNSTPSIVEWMKNKGRPLTKEGFLNLWADFQATALRIWDEETGNHASPIILWTSDLTDPKTIRQRLTPDRYVIEVWTNAGDTMPKDLLELGYGIIVATRDVWYLDHGFWGSTKFSSWRRIYENPIPSDTGVFGGECAMWSEFVDKSGLDARIWPRAAAFAERIWSNPDSSKVSLTEERLVAHRERLVQRELVAADPVNVQFCEQYSGQCG